MSLGIYEEGLSQYTELFAELQSVDAVLERIVGSGTIPDDDLDACDISGYITTTSELTYTYIYTLYNDVIYSDNFEILFKIITGTDPIFCFTAADDFSEFVNNQGDGKVSEIVPDPVISFLTVASSLEQMSTPAGAVVQPEYCHQYF